MNYINSSQLYHHGILGQKWGVRRFQNEDGSLTSAGKRRYKESSNAESSNTSDGRAESNNKTTRYNNKAEAEARKEIKKQRKHNAKNVSLMSDEELNAQINRLQRERQLKNLTSEMVTPGRHKAKQMLDRYGGQIISTLIGGVATGVGLRYINAIMDVNLARQGYKVKGYNSDGTPNYGGNNKDD